MNPYMMSAFNDEMQKIASMGKLRRVYLTMANLNDEALRLDKQITALERQARKLGDLGLDAPTYLERSDQLLAAQRPLRKRRDELAARNYALRRARSAAEKRLTGRASRFKGDEFGYTERTLGKRSLVQSAVGNPDNVYVFSPEAATGQQYRDAAKALLKMQRSGPPKKQTFMDRLMNRPVVGAGVPARPPKPKQDHLRTLAKHEVNDALKDAERQYIKDMREARREVYDDSLPGRLARIRTLAQQGQ
jgi:hypothetical protein